MQRRLWLICALIILNTSHCLYAIAIGEKEIGRINREIVKCSKEIFRYEAVDRGDCKLIKINNSKVRDVEVDGAAIKVYGLTDYLYKEFASGNITFEDLRNNNISFTVGIQIEEKALQDYINIALSRVKKSKRVLDDIVINLKHDKIHVCGLLNLKNVKISSFVDFSDSYKFSADIGIEISGSEINLNVDNAFFNGVEHPVLLGAVLSWLNPVLDFNSLPYKVSLDLLNITDQHLRAFGRLFR